MTEASSEPPSKIRFDLRGGTNSSKTPSRVKPSLLDEGSVRADSRLLLVVNWQPQSTASKSRAEKPLPKDPEQRRSFYDR